MRYLGSQKVDVTDGTIDTTQIPAVKPDGTPYTMPIAIPGIPAGTPMDTLVKPQFDRGGRLSDQTATTMIPLPAQFVAGVAIKASRTVKLFFDYQFTSWSAFDTLMIDGQYLDNEIPEDYRNVNGLRDRHGNRSRREEPVPRRVQRARPAAPDQTVTPSLPEGSRRELTLGFGARLVKAFAVRLLLHVPSISPTAPAAPAPA